MHIMRRRQYRKTAHKEATIKLVGRLKEDVEQAETKEEKRELIENAGMELDDPEGASLRNSFG